MTEPSGNTSRYNSSSSSADGGAGSRYNSHNSNAPGGYRNRYNNMQYNNNHTQPYRYNNTSKYYTNRRNNYYDNRDGYTNNSYYSGEHENMRYSRHSAGNGAGNNPGTAEAEKPEQPYSYSQPSIPVPVPVPIPVHQNTIKQMDSEVSPFYYLTEIHRNGNLDQGQTKTIFNYNDKIDRLLEENKLLVLRNELEFNLMTTQGEKDSLNVQLTQENLDSILLM